MPAAAVIPAPIAYIKVVAVKKLVVEFRAWSAGRSLAVLVVLRLTFWSVSVLFIGCIGRARTFTLKKLECLKQAIA